MTNTTTPATPEPCGICGEIHCVASHDFARAALTTKADAAEEGVGETGWLIEENFGREIHYIGLCDPHAFWRKNREDNRSVSGRSALVGIIAFHKDANKAIRFARQEDAQQLVDALGQLLTEPRICEHMWPAPHTPSQANDAAGPTDAFHLTCPNCAQAIDLIPDDAAGQGRADYEQTARSDLASEIGKLPDDFPNFADWAVTLPAGHWRALNTSHEGEG